MKVGDYSCNQSYSSSPTFPETIKFDIRRSNPQADPLAAQGDDSPLSSALPILDPQVNKDTSSNPYSEKFPPYWGLLPLPPIATNMDQSAIFCLLGKI